MKIHELNILEQDANEIIARNKMFEITENDKCYQKGDHIRFKANKEITYGYGGKDKIAHEINKRMYEITYVLSGWGLKYGYVALGIREVRDEAE